MDSCYDDPAEALLHLTDPTGHHELSPEAVIARLSGAEDDYLSVALNQIHHRHHDEQDSARYMLVTDQTNEPRHILIVDIVAHEVAARYTTSDGLTRARAFLRKLNEDGSGS